MNVLRRFYADYGETARRARRARVRRGRARRCARTGSSTRFLDDGLAGAEARAGRARAARRRASGSPRRPTGSSTRTSRRSSGARGAAGARPTSRCSTRRARCSAAIDDAVRARDRRRGAGPDADAAADDRPARRGRVHDPRRRRAGDRARSRTRAGTSCSRSSRAASTRRSRSCDTPTACRARSWRSRCRCSSTSRRTSSRRSRTGRAPSRRASCARDPPLDAAFEEAARLAGAEGLLAVIAPASLRGDAEAARLALRRLADLGAHAARGEGHGVRPRDRRRARAIVEESVGGQGLRELYVALTRPTTTLVIVHARPLPPELGRESSGRPARRDAPVARARSSRRAAGRTPRSRPRRPGPVRTSCGASLGMLHVSPGPSSRVWSPIWNVKEPLAHTPICSLSWLCSGTTLPGISA